jgi:hypothetical protein
LPSLQSPLVFALTITIPVVEYDKDKNNWNRYLNSLQIFLGITFATFATKGNVQVFCYGILTPLFMVFWLSAYLLIRNEGSQNTMGVQFTTQGGGSVFNKVGQYTMNENWPRDQYTMGVGILYDTGIKYVKITKILYKKKCRLIFQRL